MEGVEGLVGEGGAAVDEAERGKVWDGGWDVGRLERRDMERT